MDQAPRVGLEPTTTRLTAGCSTIELSGTVIGGGAAEARRPRLSTVVYPVLPDCQLPPAREFGATAERRGPCVGGRLWDDGGKNDAPTRRHGEKEKDVVRGRGGERGDGGSLLSHFSSPGPSPSPRPHGQAPGRGPCPQPRLHGQVPGRRPSPGRRPGGLRPAGRDINTRGSW